MAAMIRRTPLLFAAILILLAGRGATAQKGPWGTELPDNPAPKQDPPKQDTNAPPPKQDKNPWQTPMGLIATKSYFYPDLARTPGPLSSLQKFELFLTTSLSPPQILVSAAGAGISEARGTLPGYGQGGERSEEHTSELQSRVDLVCRLLLEK